MKHRRSLTIAVERLKCLGLPVVAYVCLGCRWAEQAVATSRILHSKKGWESLHGQQAHTNENDGGQSCKVAQVILGLIHGAASHSQQSSGAVHTVRTPLLGIFLLDNRTPDNLLPDSLPPENLLPDKLSLNNLPVDNLTLDTLPVDNLLLDTFLIGKLSRESLTQGLDILVGYVLTGILYGTGAEQPKVKGLIGRAHHRIGHVFSLDVALRKTLGEADGIHTICEKHLLT